jgi:hypothetical protein
MPILPTYSKSRLKRLRRELSALEVAWDEKRLALAKPTPTESDEFWAERRDALGPVSEEIEYQLSAQLIAQADRYQVPVPSFVDDEGPWTAPEYISSYFLNQVARA